MCVCVRERAGERVCVRESVRAERQRQCETERERERERETERERERETERAVLLSSAWKNIGNIVAVVSVCLFVSFFVLLFLFRFCFVLLLLLFCVCFIIASICCTKAILLAQNKVGDG